MDSTYGDWPKKMAEDTLRLIGEQLSKEATERLKCIFRIIRRKYMKIDRVQSLDLCQLVADGYNLNSYKKEKPRKVK